MATQYVYMVRDNATGDWVHNVDGFGYPADTPAIFRAVDDATAFAKAWTADLSVDGITVVAIPMGGWITE